MNQCRIVLMIWVLLLSMIWVACESTSDTQAATDGDSDQTDGDDETDTATDGDSDSEAETEPDGDEAPRPLIEDVDPFIGTGGVGFYTGMALPGPMLPFGMIKASPDTTGEDGAPPFYHFAGYYYLDPIIEGFSHQHLYGTGGSDYGCILLTALRGPITDDTTRPRGYRSHFDKSSEIAEPGYYAVTLKDYAVRAELTTSYRAAHHRYTFDANDSEDPAGYLLFDLGHSVPGEKVIDGEITVDMTDGTVSGFAATDAGYVPGGNGIAVYFHARFNRPILSAQTFNAGALDAAATDQSGDEVGAVLGFDLTENADVEVQIAISYISAANAKANLEAELSGWDFDGLWAQARAVWERELSSMRVWGGSDTQRRIMATSFFHALLMPQLFSDANGEYLGFDGEIHLADGFDYYTDFSLWDTYRTLHPFLILAKPDYQRDMAESLVLMAKQGGHLPRWPQANGYSGSMIGTPADMVLAGSYVKGITDFDVAAAYESMSSASLGTTASGWSGRNGPDYATYGYLPADNHGGSVARTLEYGVADFAIGELAKALGKAEDAETFDRLSKNYRKLWHPELQFFIGKTSTGDWIDLTDFDPLTWEDMYTEGNAWQYLWLVPHDPVGLIELFGSKDAMADKLEVFFEEARIAWDKNDPLAAMLPPSYYWHGNEPDIHAPYLFMNVNRPYRTQEWMRWVAENQYGDGPDGLAGNDDCGTLSAWYMFSAMGFYPVAGSDRYWIGAPLFPRIELDLPGGLLVVEAPDVSETNIYVQAVRLNGEPINGPYLTHDQIANGAALHFEMGATPSDWGKTD